MDKHPELNGLRLTRLAAIDDVAREGLEVPASVVWLWQLKEEIGYAEDHPDWPERLEGDVARANALVRKTLAAGHQRYALTAPDGDAEVDLRPSGWLPKEASRLLAHPDLDPLGRLVMQSALDGASMSSLGGLWPAPEVSEPRHPVADELTESAGDSSGLFARWLAAALS